MKPYHILKDFKGSQTGLDYQEFAADTTFPLSDELAAIAVKEGWVKPAVPNETIEHLQSIVAPAIGLDQPIPEGDLAEDIKNPAELRETKVEAPEETKPAEPKSKKAKK